MSDVILSGANMLGVAASVAAGVVLARFATEHVNGHDRRRTTRKQRQQKRRHRVAREDTSSSSDWDESDEGSSDVAGAVPPPPHNPYPERRSRRHRKKDAALVAQQLAVSQSSAWGFSMEEARAHCDQQAAIASARSPTQVLQELQKGNMRFWTGHASRPELSAFERRALIKTQFPSVAVLSCADSRVPVEIVFDQGLGDMFVVRVAGNALDTATTASLQYAVKHLKVKVVIVMGHEGCGAIKAAQLTKEQINGEPEALATALTMLKGNLNEEQLQGVSDLRSREREAVTTNVKSQVVALTKDQTVMKLINEQQLILVGAFYELSSGIVDFFHEVSEVEVSEGSDGPQSPHSQLPSKGVSSRFMPETSEVIHRVTGRRASNHSSSQEQE